ncbi:MAG TPA: hypothetical protein VK821_05235 [Dehalococcoidia bacterium]|nr:hypothetical protein [Dehalococcoidia bacterium]
MRQLLTRGLLPQAPLFALMCIVSAGFGAQNATAQTYSSMFDIGAQTASAAAGKWPNWTFTADVTLGSGAWVAVNVTNTPCFIGPNDPLAGTAHAGAIAWYALLQPLPMKGAGQVWDGTLSPIEGTGAVGNVQVAADPGVPGLTHVRVSIPSLEEFAQDNTFDVCLARA